MARKDANTLQRGEKFFKVSSNAAKFLMGTFTTTTPQ